MDASCFSFNVISSNESVEVVELTLNEGCVIPAHKAFWATTFYVSSGEVELTSAGSTVTLKNGESIVLEPGVVRSSKNVGDGDAVIVVIKSGELKKEPVFI